jgi:hypothetical protein
MRTNCPSGNKYYIRQASGGWNGAILGKPNKAGANVLANCVGYANGRFAEIIGQSKIQYQLVCNAENFIEKAKNYGLQVVNYPTLGGIMVWQKGSLASGDGAGHVAVVERIDSANQIYTSESSYRGSAFYNATRTNSNGRWGMGSAYKFRGCIVNPAIGDVHYISNEYRVGITYTTQVVLKVRSGPGTNYAQKAYNQLTDNAKKFALSNGCLKEGTRVTCQEVRQVGNDIWIRIPSGWIAAKYNGNIYVK